MKKVFFAMMAAAMMVSCGNTGAPRQTGDGLAQGADSLTGAFTSYDLDGFKLHVYNSAAFTLKSGYSMTMSESWPSIM